MNEYSMSDYGIFSDGINSTNNLKKNVEDSRTTVSEVKNTISNESVFMGPICDSCKSAIDQIDTSFSGLISNLSTISSYLATTSSSYKSGDADATSTMLRIDSSTLDSTTGASTAGVTTGATPVSSVTIPDDVKQAGYTVTCYGVGGWYKSGKATATKVSDGTNQKSVHEKWLADGARYKNGIAVINVNGKDHYLIATASKLGKVGDNVDVRLANGQTIPCVIADDKSSHDSNYTTYGHGRKNGSVNVLEFEVDRNVYNAKKNPTTSTWGLEWDSSSKVKRVDNYGSII